MAQPASKVTRTIQLISAALRHLGDAEHLAGAGANQSLDQAFHLAGFAPECARKACLTEAWLDKAIGHDLSTLSDELLEFALSLDAHAQRYQPMAWATRYPALAKWNPESRYKKSGSYLKANVDALLAAAKEATTDLLVLHFADGNLDPLSDL